MVVLPSILNRFVSSKIRSCLSKVARSNQITAFAQFHIFVSRYTMMQAVKQDAYGGPDTLYIGEVDIPKPSNKQVLVKVTSSAVNRADLLMSNGRYPGQNKDAKPETLGLEMAGKVYSIGPDASKWKIGDRVMALLPKGGYAEYVAVNEDHSMHVPDDMSLVHAGGIAETWLTAYQLLHLVGCVEAGDIVLIHGGGSGVGTAAVQLVKLAGAIPIVTAGSKTKIDACVNLGALAGFNYKEGEFAPGVMEATKGKGANIILDCVGGSFWKQNMQCLAFEGTWINYGMLGGGNIDGNFFGPLLTKRGRLLTSTLKSRSDEYKGKLISGFAKDALPFFSKPAVINGQEVKLKPVIDKQFQLEHTAEAHKYIMQNQNLGKVLLLVADE